MIENLFYILQSSMQLHKPESYFFPSFREEIIIKAFNLLNVCSAAIVILAMNADWLR